MSNNKQSSIDVILNLLVEKGYAGLLDEDEIGQARAIHKEEIEDAYWEGGIDVPANGQRCQDYYHETFGGEK